MSASGELSINFPKDISFISEAAKEEILGQIPQFTLVF